MRLVLCLATMALAAASAQTPVVRQGQHILWREPGEIASLDFRFGEGGAGLAPQPPFKFLEEDFSGTTPKIKVRDGNGRDWAVKFGDEAHADTFGRRMAWALGYYVTPTHFVADGTLEGIERLDRARKMVDPSGHFRSARFQLRSKDVKFLKTVSWSWTENPFLNTPELQGLKILMMLLSNWDNKDIRDAASRGTNAAIVDKDGQLLYFIDDWGGSMGKWGKVLTRNKWDAEDFLKQSSDFVRVENGEVRWGYTGQHSTPMKTDLRASDVAWAVRYLGQITDAQLDAGLRASGATAEEAALFVRGLRMRIDQLRSLERAQSGF